MDADDISYCYYIKNNKIEKEEFIYVHLKRRKMKIDIDQNTENYLITPSGFAPMREITAEYIREQNRYKGIYPVYLQELFLYDRGYGHVQYCFDYMLR